MINYSNVSKSPRSESSPSQAIIRPLPIVRLSSPNPNKILLNSIGNNSSTIIKNDHVNTTNEMNMGKNSYQVMPSPSTEERHATFVYLNKNSNLVQQECASKEKSSIWKKPMNGQHHHSHVAYIDEDDEGSVSLKSSICHSTTETSSSTTSPILSKKDRSKTLSSSSSSSSSPSSFSNNYDNGATDTNQIVLHESSV